MKKWKVDKPFLLWTAVLMFGGFLIFSSASLGLLARQTGASASSVEFSQVVLGLCLGTIAMVAMIRFDYRQWRKYALPFLVASIVLCVLVFVPHIGFAHGGAKRWILIAGISFQPAELLKLAFVIYFAAWAAGAKDKMKTFKGGFLPLLILYAICAALLLLQPDTDNLMMIVFAGMAIFLTAGGRWRYVFGLCFGGIAVLAVLFFTRPYIRQRVETFIDPQSNGQTSSYQLQQSLIAIGSGGVFGRGFGQSVQKFNFLPEPIGDSIFAVESEEFGFVGALALIIVFVLFATRGLKIASRMPDAFGRLLVVGIVIIITAQAFVNIGAMLGVLPLSGITLPFVSHGGTSLFITLLEAGIILSVSKTQKIS